ncbi:hypothetical protein RvY_07985 [Ramazzottius varieornatus]|uniref:LRRCT domain-containing protein n=1 Tax=Ramazzottius varieornatus TaxID=947166 RepID=A0A1D1V708_RAMVA|nr:hypothetical protein RvY_07985 [Ramazzottius varieornatus]
MGDLPWIVFFLLALAHFSQAICPSVCECDTDSRNRRRVICSGGGITVPDDVSFSTLDSDVEVVMITGADDLPSNTFNMARSNFAGGPTSLKELHLSFSRLDSIGDRPFQDLNDLQLLNLSYNNIKFISENNFRNLSRLTELHLDNNQISSMPPLLTLRYLTSLKVLSLSNNDIDEVSDGTLDELSRRPRIQLEYLDLSNNPIGRNSAMGTTSTEPNSHTLSSFFFQEFSYLNTLKLSNTSLRNLPWESIQKFSQHLLDLDLSYNSFTSIQAQQLELTRLRNISLRGNPIERIDPGALHGLYLEVLDLGETSQNILAAHTFDGARMEKLILSDMKLDKGLQDALSGLEDDLVSLDVSGNPDLPLASRMFEFLPALREISLARMRLSSLPTGLFWHTNSLEVLDLAENRFRTVAFGVFQPLKELTFLNLSYNLLQDIPLVLATLPALADLDLTANRLQGFPSLMVNTLQYNNTHLRSIDLQQNPWRCDCAVSALLKWVRNRQSTESRPSAIIDNCWNYSDQDRFRVDNADCAVCFTPRALRGTLLRNVPERLLESCSTEPETIGYEEVIQCYTCRNPRQCERVGDMDIVNCDNTYGRVASCMKVEDDEGIKRGCGGPDMEGDDNCSTDLGPFRNFTMCACNSPLCNHGGFLRASADQMFAFISLSLITYGRILSLADSCKAK